MKKGKCICFGVNMLLNLLNKKVVCVSVYFCAKGVFLCFVFVCERSVLLSAQGDVSACALHNVSLF